ncbi:phosphatidylinositol-specific phospholipase C1-like protein [Fibrella aquatilis]|uniref:Phosphatidylinositol-specific phospholipase C1-like protein n=1 Tax=Fibrella aquatilis TaxID=2817059 RepID=A0A939K2B2_9BACT|nr:phosphatidylinositol-specific phospholipase C1-like protein [Fibrella aquatilis]MBO0934373.1 phosphatidylinositol-specific phospholipase C1-like protein [Fibrella aquatilis]
MKHVLFLSILLLAAFVAPDPKLDNLKINQIQCIGSHNSYKQAIDPALFIMLKRTDSTRFKPLEYSHASLTEQLNLGLQNLEIDIYADTKGGRYAHPLGLQLAKGQAPYDPDSVMKEPGFKVLHVQDIDFRSNCLTFKQCLAELKRWSESHPAHYPVFITMNAKSDTIRRPGFALPEAFTTAVFDELDKVILESMGRDHLLIPDDVRGNYKTLEAAVLANNWPTMKAARGKFLFVLDETGPKRATYRAGHPSLEGRMLFTNSAAGLPDAAFMILNNAVADGPKIRRLVQQGYFVRTRADADTKQARTNDYRDFEAAQQSGAQIITTDYYATSTFFPSTYVIRFSGGGYLRRNPVVR